MFETLVRANCHSKSSTIRRLAAELLEKLYGCEINCGEIDKSVRFAHHARGCTIVAAKICSNVVIFQNVTIGANQKFNKVANEWEDVGNPILAENVVVCDGAKILGPIVIGENSVISAGAIVTRDVPANTIAYGTNQLRTKNASYDFVFRADMIRADAIIAANKRRVDAFNNARS